MGSKAPTPPPPRTDTGLRPTSPAPPSLTLTTHRESYGTTHYITRADGAHIAALAGNQLDPKGVSIGEAERLAKLFAASPLLLDFARSYLETWPAAGDDDPLAVQARAAIAAAENKP